MKKIIVFDVDGVITDSGNAKDRIIEEVLQRHGLLHLDWVAEILKAGLNRILILEKISEITDFDTGEVLEDINNSLRSLESSLVLIEDTLDFIKANYEKYDFFTNTSMPKAKLLRIFSDKDIAKYFLELLAYDDGSKKENIEYIMQVYKTSPENILFIDDKQAHIDAVENTNVHTLLFKQDGVSLEQKVENIFWK